MTLGFSPSVMQAYIAFVYIYSSLVHANLRGHFNWLGHLLVTPRFHHWHHSRDDHPNHNYASMLPFFDRLFGTHHLPARTWPPSYGIAPENSPEALLAAQQEELPAKTKEPV